MIFAPRNGATLRVCRARKSNLLAKGAYTKGAAQLVYRGHSSPVSHALFTADQSCVVSISSLDHSVMVWRYRKYGNRPLVSPKRFKKSSVFGSMSPTGSVYAAYTPKSDILTSTGHLLLEQILSIDLAPTLRHPPRPLGANTAIVPYISNNTGQAMATQDAGEGVQGGELGENLLKRAFPNEAEMAESRTKDTRGVLRWNFSRSHLPAVVSGKGDLLVFGQKEV